MRDDTFYIGKYQNWDTMSPKGIQREDARYHTYIIGKTGSGKSTLLRNLILQQIYAGHGVALIDPHGDLAEDLLEHFPASRADDLVYFNPGDLEFPIGINLLANVPPDDRHLVASGITEAFKSIWRDSWGPRMEYILYNAIVALLDCPNTTLLGLNRMLTDDDYRAWVCRQVRDPFVREFWEQEFAGYDSRFRKEAIAPIQNKIGQLLLNPPIRNVLGQVQSKIDFRFMMDGRRVFIANLSKGKLGAEKANLLGSLLTTQFQLAAMSRTDIPESERQDFFLHIDEFHNFTTDSFATILAEARKYRLCLTLSHQYCDQLEPSIQESVFGNVGSMIVFRVGSRDAELFAKEFTEEFSPIHFQDLPQFEAIIRLMEHRTIGVAQRISTYGPIQCRNERKTNLLHRSRERFATQRLKVEAKLERWLRNTAWGRPGP